MTWIQLCVEAAAAAAGSWAVISAVTELSGSKFSGKKCAWMTAGFALIQTVILLALHFIQDFSFASVILCVAATVFLSKFLTELTLLYRAFAAILVYLAVRAVDYVMLFSFGIVVEAPVINALSFYHVLKFGPIRCLFLLVDRGADLLIYFLMKRHISKMRETYTRHIVPLFVLVSAAYGIMSVLLALATAGPMVTTQVAIVISWFFILLCVCIFLCFLLLGLKYQEQKTENELLSTYNTMLEENYRRLHNNQQMTAKMIHDFNHHIGVLRELSRQQRNDEIREYIDALLETHYKEQPMCKSGNDVINAIINFQYNVNADVPSSLLAVDLCAILANQIDNAFDACKQIETQSHRAIDVHIWQANGNLFLFQVINSVESNPMAQNPHLLTTKADDSRPHGLGIESIRTTAEKYGGTLENRFQNGKFYSTVFLNLKV